MTKTSILYVEDEPFLGRIVRESLESREFTVHMVSDGKEALAAFQRERPDICVLDIMLPSRDGYSIAREIRQYKPSVPIIFVTAKTLTDDVIKGFEAGGNDYIRKPFSMEELIARVNNLLALTQKKHTGSLGPCALGEYEFHPTRYELRRGSHVKKLSHRESTLLQIIAENKNAIVLRKEILLRLWGDDSFFNSRNLDVYVKKLRDYLRDDPDIEIITIKGRGYVLKC